LYSLHVDIICWHLSLRKVGGRPASVQVALPGFRTRCCGDGNDAGGGSAHPLLQEVRETAEQHSLGSGGNRRTLVMGYAIRGQTRTESLSEVKPMSVTQRFRRGPWAGFQITGAASLKTNRDEEAWRKRRRFIPDPDSDPDRAQAPAIRSPARGPRAVHSPPVPTSCSPTSATRTASVSHAQRRRKPFPCPLPPPRARWQGAAHGPAKLRGTRQRPRRPQRARRRRKR
jgi:hypothetical protein